MRKGNALPGRLRRRLSLVWGVISVMGLLMLTPGFSPAQEQRAQIGVRLFRTLLAADQDLESKVNSEDKLELALVYHTDRNQAEMFAAALQESGRGSQQGQIKNYPLVVTLINASQLKTLNPIPAALYLTQPLTDTLLAEVIDYGITQQRMVFSPFEGHVERGVATGLAIEVRVMPYLNRRALAQSGLQFNNLLLKVAKIYEK